MKKLLGTIALSAILLGGNFASANETISGFIFKEATQPGQTSTHAQPVKIGTATCTSYFGIVALGDCSINTAMKNGKISILSYYDEDVKNILGYKKVTVKAYGQ